MPTLALRRACILVPMLAAGGCFESRGVQLSNMGKMLPQARSSMPWKAAVDAELDRYEEAPVVSPADARAEPTFGALTTVSYYGADLRQKWQDQQLSGAAAQVGTTIEDACSAADLGVHRVPGGNDQPGYRLPAGVPAFVPVWLPISPTGEALGADRIGCDGYGHRMDDGEGAPFCMFGQLALQPDQDRPLILVVHGLFDSSAHEYVHRMAALLYALGYSVLLPDLRDHGNTFRSAPMVATSIGNLEGADLLQLAYALRAGCRERVGPIGVLGVGIGGLAAIRAFTVDASDHTSDLNAGVMALSPLLSIEATARDVDANEVCPVTTAMELTWPDYLLLGGAGATTFFLGGALARGLAGDHIGSETAITAGVGLAVGLIAAVVADNEFDGSASHGCVARGSIGAMFRDTLQARWRSLLTTQPAVLAPDGRKLAAERASLGDYLAQRTDFYYRRLGIPIRRFDSASLAAGLLARPQLPHSQSRLLVLGAEDDPLTRGELFLDFARRVHGIPDVYARAIGHGGHGGMWIVQQAVMEQLLGRFFSDAALNSAQAE